MLVRAILFLGVVNLSAALLAAHPLAADGVTSLTNPSVKFTPAKEHYAVLRSGKITAVIVDNADVDVPECPGHKASYSGLAVLRHADREGNWLVPSYAGLNFEHIHDGSAESISKEKLEPRKAAMELRVVDPLTVELHQPPTSTTFPGIVSVSFHGGVG